MSEQINNKVLGMLKTLLKSYSFSASTRFVKSQTNFCPEAIQNTSVTSGLFISVGLDFSHG